MPVHARTHFSLTVQVQTARCPSKVKNNGPKTGRCRSSPDPDSAQMDDAAGPQASCPTCSTGRTSRPNKDKGRMRGPPIPTAIVHSTSASIPTNPKMHSMTKKRGDTEAEAVVGPPQEAPVARNEKGRPAMAPGSPGTKRTGAKTGKIRTAGAGETPIRGLLQTKNGDLRNMKNTKKLKKKKWTGTPVKNRTRTLPPSPPRSASLAKRIGPQHHRPARDPEAHRSVMSLSDASKRKRRSLRPLQRTSVPIRWRGCARSLSFWSSSLRRASPHFSAPSTIRRLH